MPGPFILLDDARTEGASPARLYRDAVEMVVARRVEEVEPALGEARRGCTARGTTLRAISPTRRGSRSSRGWRRWRRPRTGAAGPLLWFGAFAGYEEIAAAAVPQWLAGQAGQAGGPAAIGPLEPQVDAAAMRAAFAALQGAIAAGDIYQANLTFRSRAAGAAIRWRFTPALRAGGRRGLRRGGPRRRALAAELLARAVLRAARTAPSPRGR